MNDQPFPGKYTIKQKNDFMQKQLKSLKNKFNANYHVFQDDAQNEKNSIVLQLQPKPVKRKQISQFKDGIKITPVKDYDRVNEKQFKRKYKLKPEPGLEKHKLPFSPKAQNVVDTYGTIIAKAVRPKTGKLDAPRNQF